jgi:hypothetical protein
LTSTGHAGNHFRDTAPERRVRQPLAGQVFSTGAAFCLRYAAHMCPRRTEEHRGDRLSRRAAD